MTISHKLILSFLLVASLASVTTVFTLRSYKEINNTFAQLINDPTKMVKALGGVKQAGMQVVSSTSELNFIHSEALRIGRTDPEEEKEVQKLATDGRAAFKESLEKYTELVETVATDEGETLDKITRAGHELINTSDEIIELNRSNQHRNELLEKRETFETQETLFLGLVDQSLEKEFVEQASGQAAVAESIELATERTLIITVSTFLLAIFSGFYISFLISRRIKNLREATQRVGAGELNTRIEISSGDEVGDLSRAFNKMISDLSESRNAILSSQNFTENILGSMANILLVLDTDLVIVRVNQSAIDLSQFTSDELVGQSIKALSTDGQFLNEQDLSDLRSIGSVRGIETFLKSKNEHEIPVLFSASLMRDINGAVSGIVCVAQDITELRILKDKVQRGQKLESIGQLAAGIAHEINTPTQYVGDNVKFLEESFADIQSVLEKNQKMIELCRSQGLIPAFTTEMETLIKMADIDYLMLEVPKSFNQASAGVQRIAKIVQSMKDFAHPGVTEKRSADLNKAIESTITVASNEWKYLADIETDYDTGLPLVLCQVGEINQVVLNMIVNAAHAIGDVLGENPNKKGKITVSTRQRGNWAEIRITDTGKGIAADVVNKIFDPFYTTKEVGKGTGQGLAISHSIIVDKHKGTIDVESDLDVGTRFTIRLPIAEEMVPSLEMIKSHEFVAT